MSSAVMQAQVKSDEIEETMDETMEEITGTGLRYFVIYDINLNKTKHEFTGKTPAQAIKKAATRKIEEFYMRERGVRPVVLRHYKTWTVPQKRVNPTAGWMQKAGEIDDNGNIVYTSMMGRYKFLGEIDAPDNLEM